MLPRWMLRCWDLLWGGVGWADSVHLHFHTHTHIRTSCYAAVRCLFCTSTDTCHATLLYFLLHFHSHVIRYRLPIRYQILSCGGSMEKMNLTERHPPSYVVNFHVDLSSSKMACHDTPAWQSHAQCIKNQWTTAKGNLKKQFVFATARLSVHTGTIDELIWLKWRSPSLAVWVPNPHRCLLAFNRFNGDLPTKSTQICWRRADTNCLKHDKMGKREKVRQRTFDLSKRVGNANFSKKHFFFEGLQMMKLSFRYVSLREKHRNPETYCNYAHFGWFIHWKTL